MLKTGEILRRFSFPKTSRLISNRQFKAVISARLFSDDGTLTLYVNRNSLEHSRMGISISKSSGNSVIRNRLKRLLREAFRQNKDVIPSGFDYVVLLSRRWNRKMGGKSAAKADIKEFSFERVRDSFVALAIKLAG